MSIKGLDKLTKNLDEAQRALAEIDGELGTVSFNPNDPASIEAAIKDVENLIDQRLGPYSANPVIGPLIDAMKERYRDGIVQKAATERLEGEQDGE
jgi:hypothetical protein